MHSWNRQLIVLGLVSLQKFSAAIRRRDAAETMPLFINLVRCSIMLIISFSMEVSMLKAKVF